MYRWIVWVIAGLTVLGCGSAPKKESAKSKLHVAGRENLAAQMEKPYVILVSIDGYRHDYTDRFKPKNLLAFRNAGSFATSLRPIYPSKTFPNHYSIATGVYADTHGIVSNKFYSRELKKNYKLSDRSAVTDGRFYGGTPLWVVAEKSGMLSASYYWPGSEANIQGVYPNYYYEYDHHTPHDIRVNQIISWLKLPEKKRPHFLTLYFPDVDDAGHRYGTDSKELEEAVLKVDKAVGRLVSEVKMTKMPVNIIIVSDHGMTNVSAKKVEYLSDFLTEEESKGLRLMDRGSQMFLYSDSPDNLEKIYHKLKFDVMGAQFKVYKKKDVPEKYNYSHHPHIGDLVLVAKPPYTICLKKGCRFVRGVHGFDPYRYRDMHGIFYAYGPNIVSGKRIPTMNNVHVYPGILKILGLKPLSPIDGNLKYLKPILKR